MIIDLRKDAALLRNMLVRCVMRYSTANRSPVGRSFHPPVTRVDVYFTLGDGTSIPHIYLDLDTRPGSEPDGRATHTMYDFAEMHEWGSASRYLSLADENRWPVILPNGKAAQCSSAELEQHVVSMMVEVLKSARDQAVFKDFPKGERCELGVQSHEGIGWPPYEERGKENLA
jgi:hypothetical protein